MGIYVTSHPLSSIRDTLKYLTTDTVSDILENPENDKSVTICGLLSQVVQKATRKDPSKFLKTGIIEFDVFLLTVAMFALGVETNFEKIKGLGLKPILLAGIMFIWLVAFGAFTVNFIV